VTKKTGERLDARARRCGDGDGDNVPPSPGIGTDRETHNPQSRVLLPVYAAVDFVLAIECDEARARL
jgi:hypothetical protein